MKRLPRYEKLKQLLRNQLHQGKFGIGDRFYSQNDLIQKYNLSFSTVTRALTDLERDGLLLREQGRGTFVRALPSKDSPTSSAPRRVAVFMPWDRQNAAHVNFQRLFVSLEQSLPAAYQIRLIPFAPTPDELDHFLFPKEAIDAALFAYPGDEHLPFIAEMARLHPVVVLGRKLDVPGAACVYTDNKNAAETAVLHLVSRGHTVIGMLSGPMEMTDSRERQEGYSQALRSSGIPLEESLIVYTSPLELNGFRAMLELFDRNTVRRITAVFAAGDLIAIGALSALESMGIRVPEELSVIGIDDIDEAARLRPPLTTMRIPIPELARNAAALVVSAVDQGTGKTVIEMPAVLVERESVGNRAAGAQTTQSRLSPRPRGNKT